MDGYVLTNCQVKIASKFHVRIEFTNVSISQLTSLCLTLLVNLNKI